MEAPTSLPWSVILSQGAGELELLTGSSGMMESIVEYSFTASDGQVEVRQGDQMTWFRSNPRRVCP
jgi:hypothetical protein